MRPVDLCVQYGRSVQSRETGFIHTESRERISLLENFCFALGLLRPKQGDNIGRPTWRAEGLGWSGRPNLGPGFDRFHGGSDRVPEGVLFDNIYSIGGNFRRSGFDHSILDKTDCCPES